MKLNRHEDAAADLDHLLAMQAVVFGPNAAELVPTAEKLCKAHVLMRRWQLATAALERAHAICVSTYGAEHRETLRLADVLASVSRYAGGSSDARALERR